MENEERITYEDICQIIELYNGYKGSLNDDGTLADDNTIAEWIHAHFN